MTCQFCHKALNRYNPGPLCHACDYDSMPAEIRDLFDLFADSDRIRSQTYGERWSGYGASKSRPSAKGDN